MGRTQVFQRRRGIAPDDGWNTPVASALALAGFLALVFVGFTLLALEPLMAIDAYFNLDSPSPAWVPVLHVLDRVGQRAVCLPLLAVVVGACWLRRRSWRPPLLAAGAVFSLNLFVLILKVGLGRGQPASADPSFFIGGMAYPSGHTSNIVLVYGLAVYLLGKHYGLSQRAYAVLWAAVGLLSVVMVIVSMSLNWHWFADLVAGLIVGGVVLELAVAADLYTTQRESRVGR
jgi:hypothetical protein